MMKKLKTPILKLPTLITAEDYHEFGPFLDKLNGIVTGGKVKMSEVFDDNLFTYVSIIYIGRKPSKSQIREMLKDNFLI